MRGRRTRSAHDGLIWPRVEFIYLQQGARFCLSAGCAIKIGRRVLTKLRKLVLCSREVLYNSDLVAP